MQKGDTMNRLPLRHILCPMDLSSLSMNSLEWANAIARARSAELRAFHVVVTGGLVVPEGLGSLERDDIMMKLREALIATDSRMSTPEQLSGKGTLARRFSNSRSRCLPMWLSWGLLGPNDRAVRWVP